MKSPILDQAAWHSVAEIGAKPHLKHLRQRPAAGMYAAGFKCMDNELARYAEKSLHTTTLCGSETAETRPNHSVVAGGGGEPPDNHQALSRELGVTH